MITGAHVLLYTSEPDEVRRILGEVFGFGQVDAGHGWLIFALPPAEVAVHPVDGAASHELTFMCDDIHATVAELRDRGLLIRDEPHEERWGIVATVTLPGDLDLMVYEPRHPTAI